MAYKNRFHKTTLGVDAQVFVAKAVEYTAHTTLAAFQASAAEGEVGIFNAATNARLNPAGAIPAGTEVFIAVKRDGNVETSTPFKTGAGNLEVSKTAYSAPVKHAVKITAAGTQASKVIQDITYTSVKAGTTEHAITVAYVVAGNSTPLSVSVSGKAITVNLATNGTGTATSTATDVAAAVNASAAASALVSAAVTGTGSTVQAAASATALEGAVAEGAVAKGDQLEVAVIETTPGLLPLPTINYTVEVKQGETFSDAVIRLVKLINDKTSIENQDKTLIVDATISGGNDITLTAKSFGEHFKVALRGKLADHASQAVTAQFKLGNGTPEQVKLAEEAGDVRKGIGHQYPDQNATAAEFGLPVSFADANGASAQYDSISFKFTKVEATRTLGTEGRVNRIFFFVPSNGAANPAAELATLFGL